MARIALGFVVAAVVHSPVLAQSASSRLIPGLDAGQRLGPGERAASPNGKCTLLMQPDGNLVWRFADKVLWHAATYGNPNAFCVMQADGNLVVYSAEGTPLWSTRTGDKAGAVLRAQDDGNLVVYQNGTAAWTCTSGKTAVKLRFTRNNNGYGLWNTLYLCVNGKDVAENKPFEGSKCVEVECDDVAYGKNEVRIYSDPGSASNRSPFYTNPAEKTGYVRYFRVTHPGQVVDVTVEYNTLSRGNKFEVSGEVPAEWRRAEVMSVTFDKELDGRATKYTPWQDPPPVGASQSHEEVVKVCQTFTVSERWKVEGGVKGTVVTVLSPATGTVGAVEAHLRAEYEKFTKKTEVKSTEVKRSASYSTPANPPRSIRFARVDLYQTGKAVLLVDGLLVYDVPIEILEDYTIRVEEKRD